MGITMIIVGCISFLTITHKDDVKLTSEMLPKLYLSIRSIIFLVISIALVIFANILDFRGKEKLKQFAEKSNLQISDVVKEMKAWL